MLADEAFRAELSAFVARIAPAGAVNGLVQVALKLLVPGVPDFYQGTEFWDQSLVDPDNRRPVDFPARERALRHGGTPPDLLAHWQDGRVKQAVIHRLLGLRAAEPGLFAGGSYAALALSGAKAAHLIAFMRRDPDRSVLAILPRCVAGMVAPDGPAFRAGAWGDTRIALPEGIAGRGLRDVLSGKVLPGAALLHADAVLQHFPLAVLRPEAG